MRTVIRQFDPTPAFVRPPERPHLYLYWTNYHPADDGFMIFTHQTQRVAFALRAPAVVKRYLTSLSADRLARPIQSYVSTSRDPCVNLSIEHHLLQKSDPTSAILFLYINRPSIIIGRNQNPWLEVNLALLNQPVSIHDIEPGVIDLVRRRSGGGTVFHDEGNVNWTVISPSATFTRDKHAEMVVRGLRRCGIDRARVNERHDIVLDQGERHTDPKPDPDDTHATPYQADDIHGPRPLKVSGSAYKLIRNRALHHGTCLLSSPNLSVIPRYLHSPAKPFITARGVESVSSPVGNISMSNDDFIAAVQQEFTRQYSSSSSSTLQALELGDECLDVEEVKKGYEELKSKEWTYLQTPQFSLATGSDRGLDVDIDLTVRYGAITDGIVTARYPTNGKAESIQLEEPIIGQRLHEIDSWHSLLKSPVRSAGREGSGLIAWLEKMIPTSE